MIAYNQDKKIFTIEGKDYSYAIWINDGGYLQHLYYGAKISLGDGDFLVDMAKTQTYVVGDLNADMIFDCMPTEIGTFGKGDYNDPTVLFKREDGSLFSKLKYKSHQIMDGAPTLSGLPSVRSADKTLKITLKEEFSPIEIDLFYTVCDGSNVLARHLTVRNLSQSPVFLKKAFSFCLTLGKSDYDSLRLGGRWASERTDFERAAIPHGITKIQSLRGASSHKTHPFLGILKKETTEDSGECLGVQFVYSGSFAVEIEHYDDSQTRVQGGICDVGFEWKLDSLEEFVAPQALLCYSCEGLGGMSREYADFLRERVINPRFVKKERPIVVNNWEATYFDFNNEKLYPIIDAAKDLGIDTFVLDDGWFGKRVNDRAGLGDWFVNEERLAGGLKSVIDRCKSHGLKFGLWFEPEMVNEDSDLYRKHPDWAIKVKNVEPSRHRNQLILDFTKREVVDYIYDSVSAILRANDISYVKWDMNRFMSEYYSYDLESDRQGEFTHRYILGVYDLANRLIEAFPNVFFEGCASGGGRFDAGMLYYFSQIWTSDDTDGYERTKIQWGTSICYPLSAISCHVSVCPNHQTWRNVPFKTRGAVASIGPTGYELDISKLSREEKDLVKKQVLDYKKISNLILEGDLYRLLSPHTENYFCVAVVSKDKSCAYVVGERLRAVPCDYNHYVHINGLDKAKTYLIEELGLKASGKALKSAGVLLPKIGEYEAFCWHLKEV